MSSRPIGMMNSAYFVSRTELLQWINTTFDLQYTKIEQCCSGVVHCLIMDKLNPGVVPRHKINHHARYDYEYIKNYKILQAVFKKLGIQKVIEVNKLIKGRHQDNLEFMQWMKQYFDSQYSSGSQYSSSNGNCKKIEKTEKKRKPLSNETNTIRKDEMRDEKPMKPVDEAAADMVPIEDYYQMNEKCQELTRKLQQFKESCASMQLTINSLEKERDFYFTKLTEVENICQRGPNALMDPILSILYATED